MKIEKTSMKPFSFKEIFNANEMKYAWIKLSSRIKFATHVIWHMDDEFWWWMNFYSWNILAMQMEIGHTNELMNYMDELWQHG
jgi:hypothetical protein